MEAQESLRPQGFSLAPELILPALFLAHLGMSPLDTHGGNWVERWVPLLISAQYDLVVLLDAWYLEWIRGPSEAAHRCRQVHNIVPSHHPRADEMITTFEMLFGKQLTQSIRTTERLEPILLRGLAEISTQLFHKPLLSQRVDGSFGFSQYPEWIPPPRKRRRGWSMSLPEQLLRGLLAIGSWQTTELPDEIACLDLQKSEEVLQAWIRWRAGYSDEIPAWIVDYLVKHLMINEGEQLSLD